ncbi:MAG: hypothetical protein ABI607_02985 [Betaproteobacteria bacterium]
MKSLAPWTVIRQRAQAAGTGLAAVILLILAHIVPVQAADEKVSPRTLSAAQFHQGVQLAWRKIVDRHPAPFRIHSKARYEAEVTRMMQRASDISEARAFIEMSRLIGMLPDGHNWVSVDDNSLLFSKAVQLRFWQFADGLYVRAAAPSQASLLGAKVVTIGGMPIAEAWTLIRNAVGGGEQISTTRAQIYVEIPAFLEALGLAPSDNEVVLGLILRDGTATTKTIRAKQYENYSDVWNTSAQWTTPENWLEPDGAKRALWFARRDVAFWSTYLADSRSLYVAFNKATIDPDNPWNPKDDKLRPFLTELFKRTQSDDVDRLIIDLRNNNGGDSALWQPLVHHIIRAERLFAPGRLFVITSRLTESAAVAWAAKINMHSPALFVGEATVNPPNFDNDPAGRRRESYHIPGSAVNFRIANMIEYWSDSGDDRDALYPDIPVSMRWSDFINGHDPALLAIAGVSLAAAKGYLVDADGNSTAEYPWTNYRRKSQVEAMKRARTPR